MTEILILGGSNPEKCNGCQLGYYDEYYGEFICAGTDRALGTLQYKPDWCPRRPLPERKDNADMVGFTPGKPITKELADKLVNFGFNICLDEITGDDGGEKEIMSSKKIEELGRELGKELMKAEPMAVLMIKNRKSCADCGFRSGSVCFLTNKDIKLYCEAITKPGSCPLCLAIGIITSDGHVKYLGEEEE